MGVFTSVGQIFPFIVFVQKLALVDKDDPMIMNSEPRSVFHHLQEVVGLPVGDDVANVVYVRNRPDSFLVPLDVSSCLYRIKSNPYI